MRDFYGSFAQIFPLAGRAVVPPVGIVEIRSFGRGGVPGAAGAGFSSTAECAAVPRRMRRNRMAQPSLRVETAPAVNACQSSSPPARFSAVAVFQAPRIPM